MASYLRLRPRFRGLVGARRLIATAVATLVPAWTLAAAPAPSIHEALRIVAGRAGVDLVVRGSLPSRPAAVTTDHEPLEAAVRHLLQGMSYVLVRKEDAVARPRVEIRVLAPDRRAADEEAARLLPGPPAPRLQGPHPGERPLEDLARAALYAASPDHRALALDALAYRAPGGGGPGSRAGDLLIAALHDPHERVREQALQTLKDTADALPLAALAQMTRQDASVARRVQALELLVERAPERSHALLRLALSDPEPAVSRRARELMADWHLTLDEPGRGAPAVLETPGGPRPATEPGLSREYRPR